MDNIENNNVEKVEAEATETPVVEAPVQKNSNVFAILALVCGILGIIFNCCCGWLSIPFGIAALVLALVAPKKGNGKLEGMALAGLILGIVTIVFFVVSIIFTIFLPAFSGIFAGIMEELY